MTNHPNNLPMMSWTEVWARRLERHGLSDPPRNGQIVERVSAICGAHAQVMSAAELSIGLRVPGTTRTEIRQALWADHSLIKTYGPRGTVHIMPTQDLPMWCGALSATPYGRTVESPGNLLTPEQAEVIIEAIAIVLSDAELTTDELTEALAARVGSWAGEPVMPAFQAMWPRWRMAQAMAGVRGALCFGPNRGRNVTFTSPQRWLPGFMPAEKQNALSGVVKHYLYAYGPATPQQFAQWLAVPRRWAADLFANLSGELQEVECEGTQAWVVSGDTTAPSRDPQGVRLLPYFDAYPVGCHPRNLLYPGRAAERALAGGQAGNFPVLLIDGIVSGVWHQSRQGRKIKITVEPLGELTTAQRREVEEQVQGIGEFLEGKPEWSIGPVTSGAHA